MIYKKIVKGKPGTEKFLLGNEAIVRGAYESGIDIYTYYPGTPSSEVGEIFMEIFRKVGMKWVESSINEKVAMEVAGAAYARGATAMVGMKNVGLNVGSTFRVFETEFCKAGVLICADVFYPRTVKRLASLGAEIIFLPVSASRTHPHVKGHPLTEQRAKDNKVFILKNGNTRSNSRGGNSAIISPWGILSQAKDEVNTKIVSADLDITKLRKYRRATAQK